MYHAKADNTSPCVETSFRARTCTSSVRSFDLEALLNDTITYVEYVGDVVLRSLWP